MTAEETFVPTRGDGFAPNRLNLVTDLKDAYAGIGLVPAVRPYPEGVAFPDIDPDRFVEVRFRSMAEARRSMRAYEHSSRAWFGDQGWRDQRVGRQVVVAVPLADVPELIRCLRVERATPVETSAWQRFLEAVAR